MPPNIVLSRTTLAEMRLTGFHKGGWFHAFRKAHLRTGVKGAGKSAGFGQSGKSRLNE
jgi:hypothetical protein